jgi:hypothetical protein
MMNFFRKYKRAIFIITIIAFIISLIPCLFYSQEYAVKVNGVKIPLKLFNLIYSNSSKIYEQSADNSADEKNISRIKARIIQSLVQDEILYQQSKLYGVTVGDKELKEQVQSLKIFKTNGAFDIQKYYSFLNSVQMTPKEYETLLKKQIAASKLKMLLISSTKLWNYERENAHKYSRLDTPSTENALRDAKAELILNEWYSNVLKNSKIKCNSTLSGSYQD